MRIERHSRMSPQHLSKDSSLDYLIGELQPDVKDSCEQHVEKCKECNSRMEQYRDILRYGHTGIADGVSNDLRANTLRWSIEDGEKRLYAAIESEAAFRTRFQRV